MKRLTILSLIMVIVVGIAYAQKTTRKPLKLKAETTTEAEAVQTDSTKSTIAALTICGYEKAQNSSSESMFVYNGTEHSIRKINMTISYLNSNDEVLHKRTETITCDIEPNERESINIKSWDKQRLWYYKLTQAKHNDYCTPFDVSIKINWVQYKHK